MIFTDTISSHLPHILMRLSEPFALNYKQFQRSLVPVTMQAPDVENLRSGFAGNGEISGCAAPVHSLNVHLQLALEKCVNLKSDDF